MTTNDIRKVISVLWVAIAAYCFYIAFDVEGWMRYTVLVVGVYDISMLVKNTINMEMK